MAGNNAVYEAITDRIVALIEQGVVPWRRPWRTGRKPGQRPVADLTNRPMNGDGRPYHGINFLILATEAMVKGYSNPVWLTFKKARELGGCVRKGEHGTMIVFWKQLTVADKQDDGSTKEKRIPLLRYSTVFNVEQCDGVTLPKRLQPQPMPVVVDVQEVPEPSPDYFPTLADCEDIVAKYVDRPEVIEGNGESRAYYVPGTDKVHMPSRNDFRSVEEYYGTLFHELGHSTGAKHRLNREFAGGFGAFGSPIYSREELVAELTSAFLCAEAGIDGPVIENQAAYLANWAAALKNDPRAIVVASGQAQKAADYIKGERPHVESEDDVVEQAA